MIDDGAVTLQGCLPNEDAVPPDEKVRENVCPYGDAAVIPLIPAGEAPESSAAGSLKDAVPPDGFVSFDTMWVAEDAVVARGLSLERKESKTKSVSCSLSQEISDVASDRVVGDG